MSTPKAALNRRIKISSKGRPYVDLADLVKTRLDRIEKSREQGRNSGSLENTERTANQPTANQNQNGNNQNGDNSHR